MNIGKWFVMLVVMLTLTGAVLAESNDTNSTGNNNTDATQGQALNVRYDQLQCKVAFTNTQIDLLSKYVSVDQSANKNKLLTDMTTLKTYLDTTNKDSFDSYAVQTVRPDLQKATQDLNDAKKNFKQYNVSNESRTAFINEFKSAKDTYSNCIDDKEVKMANVMEKHMDNWNKQWSNITTRMSDKNMSVADMNAIMTEITAKNAELQALINSGNITSLRDFMQAYQQSQLHFAARFEIARLESYKEKLAPLADRYNMTSKIGEIDSQIANAQKYAQEGYKYKDGEFNTVWNDIKSAGKDMQQAAKDINAERVKERQDKITQRQNNITGRQNNITERQQNGQKPPRMPPGRGPGPNTNNNTNNNNS
jgi:hypothetical protein